MINGKTFLAIITARGGSKGLPGKNIKPLNGKPLIAWTIEAAKMSSYIDRVLVSTDCIEIADVSTLYGGDVPFLRPEELATDTASSEDVIIHALNWLKINEHQEYDYFVLLQPTSPLRNATHVDEAIEKFFSDSRTMSLVSVTKAKKSPFWMKTINNKGFLDDFVAKSSDYSRRQDCPDVFVLNGAIYIISCKDFFTYRKFTTSATAYYELQDIYSADIDNKYDFIIAESIVKKILKL